jgi:predicted RNA-binding Zn-ribbon protein involved in translation (DUF1610 family)
MKVTVKTDFDSQPLKFNCPKCGHQISKTVGWLKLKNQKCPSCGFLFVLGAPAGRVEDSPGVSDEGLGVTPPVLKVKKKL